MAAATALPTDFDAPNRFERLSAGKATSRRKPNADAFSHPTPGITFQERRDFQVGNGFFRKLWVSSPASTRSSDGLGPLFNSRACQRCHRKDGRGRPPRGIDDDTHGLILRLAVPPADAEERAALANLDLLNIPEPVYGAQLQHLAVPGLAAEGRVRIEYDEFPVALGGGEEASLRRPTYEIVDLGYGPLHPELMTSPRIAPPMIGLGLLEEIHVGDLFAQADPDDRDGDGITGRVSWTRDLETGERVVGRFGWKATAASVAQQSALALSGDIGISSSLVPDPSGDCTGRQPECRAMPNGVQASIGDTEAVEPIPALLAFYSRNLAVPVRRKHDDPQVLRGKSLFFGSGCADCHRPAYVTRRDAAQESLAFQLIWPYTDLLLHDMGEALADGMTVGNANGREWRTPPLWGIGLTRAVGGDTFFLHDGRARNLLEAILWHGGEAQRSRDRVVDMSPEDRQALLRFLQSL